MNPRHWRTAVLLWSLTALCTLVSAAIVEVPLSMPTIPREKLEEDQDISYRGQYPIFLHALVDSRQHKDSIAYKSKPDHAKTSWVGVKPAVGQWMTDGILKAGASRSLRVVNAADSVEGGLQLTVTIDDIGGVISSSTFIARVAFTAALRDSAQLLWSGAITGYRKIPGTFPVSDNAYGRCLEAAFGRALDTLTTCLSGVIDSLHRNSPAVLNAPPFGGRYAAELIDSICGLNKSLYVISGRRSAQSVHDFFQRQAYVFKNAQKAVLGECPYVKGELFVLMEIQADGTVGYAEVAERDFDCPQLCKKVIKSLKKVPLKSIKEPGTTAVVYRIGFQQLKQPPSPDAQSRGPGAAVGSVISLVLCLLTWFILNPMMRGGY